MQVPIATRRFVFIPMDLQDLSVGLLQVPNKQWGASGYAVTFPIAFNVVYNVLSIPQTTASTSNAYWGRFYITALTKNGFNVSDTGAGSNRWIAIGSAQPQWGFEETETKTIAFPISFESIKYVFLSKIYGPASGGADTVAYNFFRKSLTGVSFDYAYTRNWLAIGGKQPQWGYSNSTGVTFPIAFRECYAVVSNAHSNTTGNTDHYHLLSWTATGAAFGYWNMSFYGTLYIALGVE